MFQITFTEQGYIFFIGARIALFFNFHSGSLQKPRFQARIAISRKLEVTGTAFLAVLKRHFNFENRIMPDEKSEKLPYEQGINDFNKSNESETVFSENFESILPKEDKTGDNKLAPNTSGFVPIGWGVRLVTVASLGSELGMESEDVLRFLQKLQVPVLRPPNNPNQYFNLPTLELALYACLRWQQPDWDESQPHPLVKELQKVDFLTELREVSERYATLSARNIRKRVYSIAQAVRIGTQKRTAKWSRHKKRGR